MSGHRRSRLLASLFVGLAAGPAVAALPPYYERASELASIIGDPRVQNALQSQPIDAIERIPGNGFRVRGGTCRVDVRFVIPQGAEPGPPGGRQSELAVGTAVCQ